MKLPDWAPSLRPLQSTAIEEITAQFQSTDIVFFEAPTGAGKTLIAELVRQSLGDVRGIYLCSSLSLQEQFSLDFPEAAVIKGRSNYPTLDYPERYSRHNPHFALSTADCNKRKSGDEWNCSWCSLVPDCPYESAKRTALRSKLVCANSYYFLYEANHVGTLSHRDLVVVDEVDTLESVLMGFIQVSITQRRMEEFGLPYPGRKTILQSWIDWAEECQVILNRIPTTEQQSLFDTVNLKELKKKNRLKNFKNDLKRLLHPGTGLPGGNWIYDGYRENDVIFKPITVSPYAEEYLWKHGKKWLMMSATIISQLELAQSLGLG